MSVSDDVKPHEHMSEHRAMTAERPVNLKTHLPESVHEQSSALSPERTREVFTVVKHHLFEVMELEEGELEIELTSLFQDDLEIESIEMIALGDALRSHYSTPEAPARVDFARWLTQLSIEQLMELKVADLVLWLARELDAHAE